eukprot:SAG11_NODE_235_length_11852_cov_4.266020_14_plen_385_part_00
MPRQENHLDKYHTEPIAILQNLNQQKEAWSKVKASKELKHRFFGYAEETEVKNAVMLLAKTTAERSADTEQIAKIMANEAKMMHEIAAKRRVAANIATSNADEALKEHRAAAQEVKRLVEDASQQAKSKATKEGISIATKASKEASKAASAEASKAASADANAPAIFEMYRTALAKISILPSRDGSRMIEEASIAALVRFDQTKIRSEACGKLADVEIKAADEAERRAEEMSSSREETVDQQKHWMERWQQRQHWDLFDLSWDQLNNEPGSENTLAENQLSLSGAVKLLLKNNDVIDNDLSDEDAAVLWSQLCKIMENRHNPERQAELFKVAQRRWVSPHLLLLMLMLLLLLLRARARARARASAPAPCFRWSSCSFHHVHVRM